MRVLRLIFRGCGDLPMYGPHPGTGILAIMLLLSLLGGAYDGGWGEGFALAGLMAAMFIPIYLAGAYSRALDHDRDFNN